MSGTLILAKTNTITLTGASLQVMVQDPNSNANGSVPSVLTFGQVNFLNGDTMRLGGQKGNGTVNFGSFSSPSLKTRNADGVSPCTVIDFGYNAAVSTGNNTVSVGDFSLGTVDILANLVHVPQGPIGTATGTSTGTLTTSNTVPYQWNIGYQYLGGVTLWNNSQGTFPSLSPVKLGNSKPAWVLAAEDIVYNGTTWSANHRRHGTAFPDGGNTLLVDGSVSWVKVEKMYQVTTYDTAAHLWYFYQEDLSTFPAAQLAALKFKP